MLDNNDYESEKENSSSEEIDSNNEASEKANTDKAVDENNSDETFKNEYKDEGLHEDKGDGSYSYTNFDLKRMGAFEQEDLNSQEPEPQIPPIRKGNSRFLLVLFVMFFVTIFSAGFFTKYYKATRGEDGNSKLPSHKYTSTVVEHVKVEPPEKQVYSQKTELYNDAQKSCVTVICAVNKNFYGQITESVSLGSGFVVSKDGYIVTNAHVVEGGSEYKVRFYDGTEANALLIGKDTTCDIAVVKINPNNKLVPVSFGDSKSVRIGDFAMAIGTPSSEDLFGTMTFGVISGLNRKISVTNSQGQTVKTMSLLQTDASLNPGNSGGPLFNMNGQVIGINTMKLSDDFEGIGFAIPSSGAVNIINSLISTGKADYTESEYVKGGAQIGIKGLTLDDDAKKEYGFSGEVPEGALIVSIEKKSSAYKAGLSVYDVICEFNGEKITTIEQLVEKIQECNPKQEVTVKVYRVERTSKKGEYHTYSFALDAIEE